jgi:N-acetylmuramoyl-L-alanine amidase
MKTEPKSMMIDVLIDLAIIIDVAHGSNVIGKQSPDGSFKEYIWSRKVGKMLGLLLQNIGFRVYFDVDEETEPGLSHRVHRINNIPEDNKFMISLHSNASGSQPRFRPAYGCEIWAHPGAVKSDIYGDIIAQGLIKDFPELTEIKHYFRKGSDDEHFVKHAKFTVLTCKCTAVLIEWCFYDNLNDLQRLKDDDMNMRYVQSLAQSIKKIAQL